MKTVVALLAVAAVLSGASAQTFTSGGTCTASADATVWKYARDGWAKACASAYVNACSATSYEDLWDACYDDMYTMAKAVVNVYVSAYAKCYTYPGGYTFGCAVAKAAADSQVQAVIKLFSEASAYANNYCPNCDPVKATAIANIWSTLIVDLDAEASAAVKSMVCVGTGQYALQSAWVNCKSEVLAVGFAKAFAKAVISGDCTAISGQAKADALAQVENSVTVIKNQCSCSGFSLTCTSRRNCKPTYIPPSPSVYYKDCNIWPKIYTKLVGYCDNAIYQAA